MVRFIGRTKELRYLEDAYAEPGFHTCAVYGRRRIGKSSLIREFCRGKRAIYIQFVENSEEVNIDLIRSAITDLEGRDPGEFENLLRALRCLADLCGADKTILVFDEFPFLAAGSKCAPSALQHLIDIELRDTETFLIVCGSSIRSMKDETEDPKRPLYGRFPVRIKLEPLSPGECREFHPNMSDIDVMKTYLAVGGIPYYHEMMNCDTFEDCIIKNFAAFPAPLSDEAAAIIDRELSPASTHSSIASFLAKGTNRIKDLSEKVKISEQACGRYLRDMEEIGLVERIKPMADAPKRPLFRIRDNLMHFYYGAIERRSSILKTSDPRAVYKMLEHDIDACLGIAFECVCSDHIVRSMLCKEIGKWWGRAGGEDRDVDIIAAVYESDHEAALFCECKFRRRPTGVGAFARLKDTSDHVRGLNSNRRFVIFSASGFDDDLTDLAERSDGASKIILIGLNDLYRA
ncbi:MAG: ATP-binding protein [Candidatus Methanoplasma sp.]|jgi:AAA+ ATPase superfamily predicted ATPase|nr:ATP-binding protein [Candidatus Methanoplasma sp.]